MTLSPFDHAGTRREDPRNIALAVAVSILVHLVALWEWKLVPHGPAPDFDKLGGGRGPLAVQILPPPAVRPQPAPPQRPAPVPHVRRPATPPRRTARTAPPRARPPAPPVIALDKPAPQAPPAPRAAPATPSTPAPAEDLSSYIESRRHARDQLPSLAFPNAQPQAQPSEDANARANRLAAANLAPGNAPAFGYDPNRGGGVFSIKHVAYDYAEFMFYGWNRDAKRDTAQLIEVRKGSAPDIRVAVVRKMIAIIRDHEKKDFLWESRRLGRYVKLSARPEDDAGLQEFMMAEFFDELRGRPDR